jgi:hypothetical protein
MKPHEETWAVEYDNDEGPGGEGFSAWFQVGPDIRVDIPRFEAGGRERAEAIAKLVSQAPAMARLLLNSLEPKPPRTATQVLAEREEVIFVLHRAGVL